MDKQALQNADAPESMEAPMSPSDWDSEYVTGAQAKLSFVEFPEPSPIKAASARITAGATPIPIYNCHRKAPGGTGGEGGAPFDDIARGRHLARLQLVVPRKRFKLIRAAFPPATDVGDAVLKYGRGDGYRLTSGVVGQGPAEEITVRSAIYSVLVIHFERARPLSAQPEEEEEETIQQPNPPFSWRGYDLRFETEEGLGWTNRRHREVGEAQMTGEVRPSPGHTATGDPETWALTRPFLFPLLEVDRGQGGVLFQWAGGQYERVLETEEGRPIERFKKRHMRQSIPSTSSSQ